MSNEKKLQKISKFLSLVLRHKPEEIGISLDENAWANTKELLEKMNAYGVEISFEELKTLVRSNDKKRFSFTEDFSLLRANQGHSIAVDLKLEAKLPPVVLYHGTVAKHIDSIKQNGLQKQERHHVHLSKDFATASNVGQRYGKPIVLKVKAKEMSDSGFMFFLSENNVWLTDHVPSRFIEV